MKTENSFAIIGLTRFELHAHQLLLNVTRKFPAQADNLLSWLNAVEEGKLPLSGYLPGHTRFNQRKKLDQHSTPAAVR